MAGVEVLAMTTQKDARVWADELAALSTRISPRFSRREPRQRAVAYLHGLLAPIERKNGWQLAEAAGDRTPDCPPAARQAISLEAQSNPL